jgi:hypothetical protein
MSLSLLDLKQFPKKIPRPPNSSMHPSSQQTGDRLSAPQISTFHFPLSPSNLLTTLYSLLLNFFPIFEPLVWGGGENTKKLSAIMDFKGKWRRRGKEDN